MSAPIEPQNKFHVEIVGKMSRLTDKFFNDRQSRTLNLAPHSLSSRDSTEYKVGVRLWGPTMDDMNELRRALEATLSSGAPAVLRCGIDHVVVPNLTC